MVIQGQLNLSKRDLSYVMFYNGRSVNLSDILYSMYIDRADIYAKIKDMYYDEVLFESSGELYKDKVAPYFYLYFVGEDNLDEVLWDNIGRRLEIKLKNISGK